jgi:hypothetical protein
MSRTISQCWQIIASDTGRPWNDAYDRDDCLPSEDSARTALTEILREYGPPDGPPLAVRIRPYRCVAVRCDECGDEAGDDDGLLHLDPAGLGMSLDDLGWCTTVGVNGRDLCPDCGESSPPTPSGPGPLDQPLPGLEPTR